MEREHKGKCLLLDLSDYVVIDIETTGFSPEDDEIIEIAALKIINDEVVDTFQSLVKPVRSHALLTFGYLKTQGYSSFPEIPYDNIELFYKDNLVSKTTEELTGITNEMLKDAPPLESIIGLFLEFVGNSVLVGHNVHFDINFLYDAAEKYAGKLLLNDFVDTLRLSRIALPENQHHRLSDIAEVFSIGQDKAHRALSDCYTTYFCYTELKNHYPNIFTKDICFPDRTESKTFKRYPKYICPSHIVPEKEVNQAHPLCGAVMVFTGELSISRKDAMQIAVNTGAIVKSSVSKKTDYLIVGRQDLTIVGDDGLSTKEEKAIQLNESGKANISIINEHEFLLLVREGYSLCPSS